MATNWRCGRFEFDLKRPVVMGILNVTPDSFSDGGQHATLDAAIRHAKLLIEQGAQIIDVGGESTRPGAEPVSVREELDRVVPVVEALRHMDVAISIDTCKATVMRAALDLGADIINDVTGFRDPESFALVSSHPDCGLCVMHMQGEPRSMQASPVYQNVVQEVLRELAAKARELEDVGIDKARICLDPGFGFGKTLAHNYDLLRHLDQLVALQYPVLAGVSRKSMIGLVTDRTTEERMVGSVAAALMAVMAGARVVRVHDVAPTVDALKVWQAMAFGPENNK